MNRKLSWGVVFGFRLPFSIRVWALNMRKYIIFLQSGKRTPANTELPPLLISRFTNQGSHIAYLQGLALNLRNAVLL